MLQTSQTDIRSKPYLKRTKHACVNCKSAKAACDSARPCSWCVRHGLQDSCVDAPRKARATHIKKFCYHRPASVVPKQECNPSPIPDIETFSSNISSPASPVPPPSESMAIDIEDMLAPGFFDFGLTSMKIDPCSSCPIYLSCAKDPPQRLLCASSTFPQTPISLSLSSGLGDSCLVSPPSNQSTPSNQFTPSNQSAPSNQFTPSNQPNQYTSPVAYETFSPFSPAQQSTPSSQTSTPSLYSSQTSTPTLYSSQSSTPAYSPQTPLTPQTPQTPQTPEIPLQRSPATSQSQIAVPQASQASHGSACCVSDFSHLPPLLDDACNCQTLIQNEMAKINACIGTINSLMQLQNVPQLATATFHLPETTLEDCNDEFARALGYDGRDDLVGSSHAKLTLLSLVPEKTVGAMLRCATHLMRSSRPTINQIMFTSKRRETKYFTVLIKPCGSFAYISILKQHAQIVEGLGMCGE